MFLQLNLIKTQADFMFDGQQFIHIPEDDSFVCITSDDNLKFMTTKCSDLFFNINIIRYKMETSHLFSCSIVLFFGFFWVPIV